MAQEVVEVDSVEETLTIVDQSQSPSSSSSSPLSSDPSSNNVILSRNASFSKLNAQAPEFVPTRPQSQPSLTVIPPPSAPAPMTQQHPHHLYSPSPSPPSPSPFHVPIHSPVPVPHMIPVHHHPHPHPPHQHHHPHHHHHPPHQQYVPVRNHNNGGGNSATAHYAPVQQQQSTKKIQSSSSSSEEEVVNHAVPASNHKKDRTGSSDHHSSSSKNDKNGLSDEAAMQKLINQVEYYFSDINLATTDHLMRFINKDPEGYVPISVVSSFKKVKAAISGNSQLAAILRNSAKLIVSEDGKKVKRQQPLTESDVEELQSRIVVAENLPEDHCHQNLMKVFSSVGSVKTIRTCPPQASGGSASSASRSGKADGMHFSNKLHAFVEYESVEIAEKAVAELNDERNWRSGLRVRLMLKRTSKPTQARGKKGHDGQGHSEEDEVSVAEQQQNEKQMEDPSLQYDIHSYEHLGEDNGNEKEGAHRKGRGRGKGKGRGRAQYHNSNRGNQVGAPPSNNPVNNEQGIMVKQPPGPRMPDGTRGFAMGRGKPIVLNTA